MVAEFLANREPDDKVSENPVMREYGARLLVCSGALTNAHEELAAGRMPSGTERLVILDALRVAGEEASAELGAFKEEQGMGRP